MKKNGFKKTAAGIMSVAMMLSAVVLPGTIKNAPAISNVLTASAAAAVGSCDGGGTYIEYGYADPTRYVFNFKDARTLSTGFSSYIHDNTHNNSNVSLILDFTHEKNADGSVKNGVLWVTEGTFSNLNSTIDTVTIGAGVQISNDVFAGSKIKNIVVNADSSIGIDQNAFRDCNLNELQSFVFNGTAEEYTAFKRNFSTALVDKIPSTANIETPVSGLPAKDENVDLPEGASIGIQAVVGDIIGGTFYVTAPEEYDVRLMFREGRADESDAYTAYNRNYEIVARAGQKNVPMRFYISPKNIGDPIYYSVQYSPKETDTLLQPYQHWTNTNFYGSTCIDQYLHDVETDTNEAHAKFIPLATAIRSYGRAAYAYFEGEGKLYGATNPDNDNQRAHFAYTPYQPKDAEDAAALEAFGAGQTFKNKTARSADDPSSKIEINVMAESRTRFQVFETKTGTTERTLIFESEPILAWELADIKSSEESLKINNNNNAIKPNGSSFSYSVMMYVNAVEKYFAASKPLLGDFCKAMKAFGYEADKLNPYK